MEQALKFSGINRVYSDYANNGSCEELINLRVTGGGVETVKGKKGLIKSVPYADIFQHNLGDRTNIIAKIKTSNGYSFRWIDETGVEQATVYTVRNSTDEVYFATLGNMIILSNKTRRENKVFRFVAGSYVEVDGTMPDVPITVSVGSETVKTLTTRSVPTPETSQSAFLDSLRAALSETEEKNPDLCFGDVLLAFNFKTKDGEEFWTYRWCYVPVASKSTAAQQIDVRALCEWNTTATREEGGPQASVSTTELKMKVSGRKITVSLGALNVGDTSMISAVNIYASKPKSILDTTTVSVVDFAAPLEMKWNRSTIGSRPNLADGTTVHTVSFIWKEGFTASGHVPTDEDGKGNETVSGSYSLETADVQGMMNDGGLLYLQKSLTVADLKSTTTIDLKFGGDSQMNGKTMIVDAGAVSRYGRMLSYNNRLHFYDCVANTRFFAPLSVNVGSSGVVCDIYYLYSRNGVDTPVYGGTYAYGSSPVIIAPSAEISTVYVILNGSAMAHHMLPSKNYNFSYGFFYESDNLGVTKAQELEASKTNVYEAIEVQDVNVTEISNPFVFAVEHSYRIPGIIQSLQPSHLAVSDVQIGQYPLNAFTDRGVFAMEQGSNGVLYSNIFPISSLRSIGETVVTPNGTFFVANRGLYMLSGRQAILVSDSLSNGPHLEIRDCLPFGALTNNDRTYHISEYLSKVTFERFIDGASLVFDPLRNELIVSNADYRYSYVFNINTRLWHKITASYNTSSNDKYLLERINVDAGEPTRATGTLTIAALYMEQSHPFASTGKGSITLPATFAANAEVSLTIDGSQVASCRLSFPAPAKIIMAALTESLAFLDFTVNNGTNVTIYANNPDITGKAVSVKVGSSTYTTTIAASPETVTIIKSIGDTLHFSINGASISLPISNGDTEVSVANRLVSLINASSAGLSGVRNGNTIELTTNATGEASNTSSFSFDPNQSNTIFTYLSFSGLSGGSDGKVTSTPNVNVLDAEYEEEGQRVIHLQTRPQELSKGRFTHIMRSVLQSRVFLDNNENFSFSVFGSDNLHDYHCISTITKRNANISQTRLPRAARSYRYYIFVIGGIVDTLTQLNDILLEVDIPTGRIG